MKKRQGKVDVRKTEVGLEGINVTPLPPAASAAAVHNTEKGLPKDA